MAIAVRIQSHMSLFVEMVSEGEVLASGTGIVGVAPTGRPALLTNWHNVSGKHPETQLAMDSRRRVPDAIRITHNAELPDREVGWVVREEPLYDGSGRPLWREHPKFRHTVDVVALPLTQFGGVGLVPYLGPGSVPSAGIRIGPAEVVSVVGFPFGLTGGFSLAVWATGFVATEPDIDLKGMPQMLIDCRTRPGQSGSPVIAYRAAGMVPMEDGREVMFEGPVSRFLGLYSGRVNAESDLGMVWKASALLEILATV